MNINDLPDKDSLLFPHPMTIRISSEAKRKLEAIEAKGKSKQKTLRHAIDNFLKDIAV